MVGRYSQRINGVTHLHVTKLDVLGQFDELKICTAYEIDGRQVDTYPADLNGLSQAKPVYTTLPGWKDDLSSCRKPGDLPKEARAYLDCISHHLGTPLASASFGPGREQTLLMS